MAEIELHPGTPFCDVATLNRIARQQGLCLAIAQASVYDEICTTVALSEDLEEQAVQAYLQQQEIETDAERNAHLRARSWSEADLRYYASRGERLDRFQRLMFDAEVELRFLDQKLDLDQITYSLIRVEDGDLAFELHQRLLEGEAPFEALASQYSQGRERESEGRIGPVPLNQAHEAVVQKLRTSRPGELLAPFFLVDIWLILRLEQWEGSRLDDDTRDTLREELFEAWLERRVEALLAGDAVAPLATHRLETL